METFVHKALRHVATGDIRFATIQRGLRQLRENYRTANIEFAELGPAQAIYDFAGHKGIHVIEYPLLTGEEKISSVRIMEVPTDVSLSLHISRDHIGVDDYLLLSPDAIASFVGPTKEKEFPNNGFWSAANSTEGVVFMDTDPSGMRRGAIAFRNDGHIEVIDDVKKWEIVNRRFEGYNALVGTSTWFELDDDMSDSSLFDPYVRSRTSYLVQVSDGSDQSLCYVVAEQMVTRYFVKVILDTYAHMKRLTSYRAVELELTGANCYVVNNVCGGIVTIIPNDRVKERRDHYVLKRKP